MVARKSYPIDEEHNQLQRTISLAISDAITHFLFQDTHQGCFASHERAGRHTSKHWVAVTHHFYFLRNF